MSDRIEFTLLDSDVRQMFARLVALGQDLSEPMSAIAGHLAAATEDAFETQSDPWTGIAWAELLPSTVKRRQRMGTWPGKKLQVTGTLAASVVADSGADFAEVQVGQSYAPFHQFGTARMAARPFLGISEETEANIRDALERAIE